MLGARLVEPGEQVAAFVEDQGAAALHGDRLAIVAAEIEPLVFGSLEQHLFLPEILQHDLARQSIRG